MKQLATAILACLIVVFPMISNAEDVQKERPPTKRELEATQGNERTKKALSDLQSAFEQRANEFKYDCLQTTGNNSFCECLYQNIPVAFSFADYVTIMISTREEIGFDQLNKEMKSAVDNAIAARDKCVQKTR
jgi:hypothetical protein